MSAPLVDEELLTQVAADPGRVAKVLCAAAQAANLLAHCEADPAWRAAAYPGPEGPAIAAGQILRHAFIDWDAVFDTLEMARPAATGEGKPLW